MRKICIITTIMSICGVAYGDIASIDYVDNGANGKQGLLSAGANISINDDTIAYTAELPKTAAEYIPGITKLYNTTGTNTDGAVTQNIITTTLEPKQDKLPTGPSVQYGGKYNVVWDGDTGAVNWHFIPFTLACPSGQYDLGFESCIDVEARGDDGGYINVDGGSRNSDTYGLTENGTWGMTFPWGGAKGDITCLSEAEGLGRTNGFSPYGTGAYSNTFIDAPRGLSGQDANGSDRKYCWFNMQSPAVSRWVFLNAYTSSSDCAADCMYDSLWQFRYYGEFRSVVFSSVGK